ncbi:MAG: hypothetical protein M1817_004321 [Caeruleum heppii]|nr:MAG: hypothetical protein M1817_004321 [Caeruleum heppii]
MSSDSLGPQWTSGYSGEHNQIGNDPGSALSAPRRAHESFSQETVNVPNSSFDLQSLPRLSGPAENTASANTSISQGTPLERPSRGASKTVRFEEPSTHLRRSLDKAPRARDDALAPHVSEEKGDTITEDGARKRPQQSLSDQQVTLLRATVEGMFQKLGVAGKLRLPEVSASESLPFDATPAATSGANLNAADIESVFQECYKQAQEKVSAPDRQDLSGQTTFAINSNDQRTPVTRPYPTPVTVGKVQNRDRVEEPASEPASQFGHSKSSSLWNAFPLSAATHTEGSSSKQHGEAGKLWADRPWEPTSGMAFGGYAPPSATRLGWDRYLDRYRKTPGSFPVMQSSMGVDPRVNQVFPANSNAHRVKSSPSTACPPGSSAVAATGAGVETSVSKCVRQLQEMGFDQPENGGVEWLSVYALEAGGDIDEALRIMEEDRKAHGLRPL